MTERKSTASKTTAAKTNTQKTDNTANNATTVAAETQSPAPTVIEEDLNLDAKVTIKNLAGWNVTFKRLQDGEGDVLIVANGQTRLSRNEIIAQVNDNKVLFVGFDGIGSHATIYIDDEATRRWVGFEEDGRPQKIFTEQLVVDLFAMKQSDYENAVRENIRTRAEKYALIETIKKLRLNDYAKIVFAQKYTGFPVD